MKISTLIFSGVCLGPSLVFGFGTENQVKLEDGSTVEVRQHGGADKLQYTLVWNRPNTAPITIWSAPRQTPPMPNGVSESPLIVHGIEDGIVSNGYLAVLLRTEDTGLLIRGKVDNVNLKFETLFLSFLFSYAMDVQQRFTFRDAFTIEFEQSLGRGRETTKQIITIKPDGSRWIDGEPYEIALGFVSTKTLPNGRIEINDPKGKIGPPGRYSVPAPPHPISPKPEVKRIDPSADLPSANWVTILICFAAVVVSIGLFKLINSRNSA